jgi:hypothetical protein
MATTTPRKERLLTYVTPDEKARLEAAAARQGLRPTQLLRRAALQLLADLDPEPPTGTT